MRLDRAIFEFQRQREKFLKLEEAKAAIATLVRLFRALRAFFTQRGFATSVSEIWTGRGGDRMTMEVMVFAEGEAGPLWGSKTSIVWTDRR